MHQSHLRNYIQNNVLTSLETAEILNLSRQRITALVKEGELQPVKTTTQGMLFLRVDVEAYKKEKDHRNRIYRINRPEPLYDNSGTTNKSLHFFKEHFDEIDEVSEIFIYFDEIDAAVDNFYIESDLARYGHLRRVDTPHFILRSKNDTEIWLGGANCGYGGEGPGGSRRILGMLRDSNKIKNFNYSDEDLRELLYSRVVKIITDYEGNIEVFNHKSLINEGVRDGFFDISADLYLFENDLVLLQDANPIWSRRDTNPIAVLKKYMAFVPNPVEVIIFQSDENAKEYGYIAFDTISGHEQVYRLIIKDTSGRQIWLCPYIEDDIPLNNQPNLSEILGLCGFDAPKEEGNNTAAALITWWNRSIRKIPPTYIEPIRLTKNQ